MFIATTLANDPHTEGMRNAGKIAELGGVRTLLLRPSLDYTEFLEDVKKYQPHYIGLSYRLTPEIGLRELEKILNVFINTGLITPEKDVKIVFAGLPETIKLVKAQLPALPLKVELCEEWPEISQRIADTVAFFDIKENRDEIVKSLIEEACPKGIELLDQLTDEVVAHDAYKDEPPLPVPSLKAIGSYTERINESSIPLLRSHFGIPGTSIQPTVEGIKEIAEARVLDEISLGSSDLSQRYFGFPEKFKTFKNDGGVPYVIFQDLVKLFQASRRGNFPGMKPYCHVVDIPNFVDICVRAGMLKGAHQAIPLFWFNELDGRGPMSVRMSLKEHFDGVRQLVKYGIPVEMNDPNQWSSRWAHDTLIVVSYALISAVMYHCGVSDMVLQMQFNKPRETGDFADLAKMSAGRFMAECVLGKNHRPVHFIIETRTGIESLSADMEKAKWQLARSSLLQLCMNPQVMHIVSYCEANYAAKPLDIIDSSRLIRKAVRVFRTNEPDIRKSLNNPVIAERRDYLVKESVYLLNTIANLNPRFRQEQNKNENIALYLADPDVLADALEQHILSAPGIINPKYKGNFITKPMKYGMINLVDDYSHPTILTEKQRLSVLPINKEQL